MASNFIEKSLDRIVEAEVQKRLKAILKQKAKRNIHFNAFIKWLYSPEILAMITVQNFSFIKELTVKYRSLRPEHFFLMQYLNKVTFASQPEIKYMLEQSLSSPPQRIRINFLLNNGMIERHTVIVFYKRKKVLVITEKGRKFVQDLQQPQMVRNFFNYYKATTKKEQLLTYKRKRYTIKCNPHITQTDNK
jgi:hypothetical protein